MPKLDKSTYIPVAVVFISVLMVFGFAYLASIRMIKEQFAEVTSSYAVDIETSIITRLNIFEETLRAGVGLLSATENLSEDQWFNFITTSAVFERYPGAQNVSYAEVVDPNEKEQFIAELKQNNKQQTTIFPQSSGRQVPITYIVPKNESNSKVIGFDISSEATRRAAINRAARTGDVAVSETVTPVVNPKLENKAFIMYLPLYSSTLASSEDARLAAVEGYVFAGFRFSTFLDSVVPNDNNPHTSFAIRLNDSKENAFEWKEYANIKQRDHEVLNRSIEYGGTTFNFEYVLERNKVLPSYLNSRPQSILLFGLVTAILTAGTVLLVLRGRENQLLLAQQRGINEAKDNLISLASHQLRTPATGVKQYLGLLLQGFTGELSDNQREIIEKAYSGNERQLKTINDVLYLARLSSGRITLTKSLFSPLQMVSDIVQEQQQHAQERGHTVKIVLPKRDKKFFGDEHMIRMAIENLLNNAIKYTHSGGKITVTVKLKESFTVLVKDNGVGIEADKQAKMFEQFERIDNELSIAVGGTGIGLYVVQNIAQLHGGRIEVVSAKGKGSTFSFVLPYEQRNKADV